MSSLDESLRQILAVGGVRTAALIDVATGMVVRSAGAQENANLPAAAASMADAARAARAAQGPGEPGGELEGIVLSTGRRVHFTRILQPGQGQGQGQGQGRVRACCCSLPWTARGRTRPWPRCGPASWYRRC